jgi:hypothetical protein
MKEKSPLLARAPRPEDLTMDEAVLQRLQDEEEERFLRCVLRIQCAVRVLVAKRRMKAQRMKKVVLKGNQPLKNRVQLRMESVAPGRQKEVVLSETPQHREFKATQKIQAHARGRRDRDAVKPVLAHKAYLDKQARVIQKHARAKIARTMEERRAAQRYFWAATMIQKLLRARKARNYVLGLKTERVRFNQFNRKVVKCQTVFRIGLAKSRVKRARERVSDNCMSRIQSKLRMYWAQRTLVQLEKEAAPLEMVFAPTFNEKMKEAIPWSWQLFLHPVDRGRIKDHPYRSIDLFAKTGTGGWKDQAAIKIQSQMRRHLATKRVAERRNFIRWIDAEVVGGSWKLYSSRKNAIVKIQKHCRGFLCRNHDVMGQKYENFIEKVTPNIVEAQAYLERYLAQKWLVAFTSEGTREGAAARIQTQWRGKMARLQVKVMQKELVWPLKGWFQYQGMSSSSVHVEVQFFANPRFDEYKHFCEYGSYRDLTRRTDSMHSEISKLNSESEQRDATLRSAEENRQTEREKAKQEKAEAERKPAEEARRAKEDAQRARQDSKKKPKEEASRSKEEAPPARKASKEADKAKARAEHREENTRSELPVEAHRLVTGSAVADAVDLGFDPPSAEIEQKQAPLQSEQALAALSEEGSVQSRRQQEAEVDIPAARDERTASLSKTMLQPEESAAGVSSKSEASQQARDASREKRKDSPSRDHRTESPPKAMQQPKAAELSREVSMTGVGSAALPLQTSEWSPRRGPLSPGTSARAHSTKDRPETRDHPLKERKEPPLSPMSDGPRGGSRRERSAGKEQGGASRRERSHGKEQATTSSASGWREPRKDSPDRSALKVLQDCASDEGIGLQSSVSSVGGPPRKHYAGTYKDGQFVKSSATRLDDLSPEEQAAVMEDLMLKRKQKVEELVRRQKKHAARRKKQQKLEAKKLGRSASPGHFSDDERRQKVRQLKEWLKRKEEKEAAMQQEMSPMEKLEKVAAKCDYSMDQLEQDHLETRERRMRIAEQKRTTMAKHGAAVTMPPQRVLHRHVHHHVHYHDGVDSGDDADSRRGMIRSASAGQLSSAATTGMPWRPLVHSASVSAGSFVQRNDDPLGMDRTVQNWRGPGAPAQHLEEAPELRVPQPGVRI